jgi:membrane fusion protein (multidrug efflux system)
MQLRYCTLFCLATVLILTGCADQQAESDAGGFTPPPVAVETARVQRELVTDNFEAVGTIWAGEHVAIVSEINGIVEALPFEEGGHVKKGDLLIQLDDVELNAQLKRSEAILVQNRASHKRTVRIVEQGIGTPQDLDDAFASLKVAESEVALAQARLTKAKVVAPFDGVIGTREISPGAYIRAGDTITDLAQISELRVVFAAPERYAASLRKGVQVAVSTTAWPGETRSGAVYVVNPIVDVSTRNLQVIARVPNPGELFLPGMSADVSAVLAKREGALTIPSEAVFAQGGRFLAYVVGEDDTVSTVTLTLGARLTDAVEVLDGLQEGQEVVRAGHQKLYPGAKIQPVADEGES